MEMVLDRDKLKELKMDALQRLEFRKAEEARLAGANVKQRDLRTGRKIESSGESAKDDEKAGAIQ